ncbi:MAG: hypothetical protein Kow0059_02270 [Candidatus Sumerlaeia bacterium]
MKIRLGRYKLKVKYLLLAAGVLAAGALSMAWTWGPVVFTAALIVTMTLYWAFRLRTPGTTPLPHLRVTEEFTTLETPGGEFAFAVIGDMPTRGPARKAVLRHAQKCNPLFLCNTGDVVKYSNPKTWRQYMRFLARNLEGGRRCFHTPGNHDIDHNVLRHYYAFYRHYFGRGSYCVDAGGWRLIFLDSAKRDLTDSAMTWLETRLSEARNQNRRTVLLTHMPPRQESAGVTHSLSARCTRRLAAVLNRHDVPVMFCGHIHRLIQFDWEGRKVFVGGLSKTAWKPVPGGEGVEPAGYYRVFINGRDIRVEPVILMPRQADDHSGKSKLVSAASSR